MFPTIISLNTVILGGAKDPRLTIKFTEFFFTRSGSETPSHFHISSLTPKSISLCDINYIYRIKHSYNVILICYFMRLYCVLLLRLGDEMKLTEDRLYLVASKRRRSESVGRSFMASKRNWIPVPRSTPSQPFTKCHWASIYLIDILSYI